MNYWYKNQRDITDSNVEEGFFLPNFPHYLYFLVILNQFIFFGISCIFSRVTEHTNDKSDGRKVEESILYKQNASRAIGNILYPIFVWICIKHGYYDWFTISMLLMITASISSQITYFLNPIAAGTYPSKKRFLKQPTLKLFYVFQCVAAQIYMLFTNGKVPCISLLRLEHPSMSFIN